MLRNGLLSSPLAKRTYHVLFEPDISCATDTGPRSFLTALGTSPTLLNTIYIETPCNLPSPVFVTAGQDSAGSSAIYVNGFWRNAKPPSLADWRISSLTLYG